MSNYATLAHINRFDEITQKDPQSLMFSGTLSPRDNIKEEVNLKTFTNQQLNFTLDTKNL